MVILIDSEILRLGLHGIGGEEKGILLLHVDAVDVPLAGLCVSDSFTAGYRIDGFGEVHLIEMVLIVYIII